MSMLRRHLRLVVWVVLGSIGAVTIAGTLQALAEGRWGRAVAIALVVVLLAAAAVRGRADPGDGDGRRDGRGPTG